MARPTCSPRLTPGQTSPRSSGNSSPPHHSCPHVLSRPFLGLRHPRTIVSTQENNHTPLSKCNRPPLLPQRCPSTLVVCPSPPLVADCALRLAAAAARCQDLFRERAGGWAGEVRAHILEHRENPALISPIPTLPNSLALHTCLLPAISINIEQDLRIKRFLL